MRKPSVANALRAELVQRDLGRSAERCTQDALALGRVAIEAYMAAHGVSRARAIACIRAQRVAGRRPSRAAERAA